MHQLDNPSPQRPPAERRVLIVDGHPLVRRGLSALIDGEPDLTVFARAAGRREALAAIASSRPDLVITELFFRDGDGGDGLDLVREIRPGHGELPVLVLSGHEASGYAERALRAGASGYASKRETGAKLLVAIRTLLDGERFVSPKRWRQHLPMEHRMGKSPKGRVGFPPAPLQRVPIHGAGPLGPAPFF